MFLCYSQSPWHKQYGPAGTVRMSQAQVLPCGEDLPILCSALQLVLFHSPSAVPSVACIDKFRCADSRPAVTQARILVFSCLLLQLYFFTPPAPIKGRKHFKRPHIRFLTFSRKERCTKTGVCHNCLVLLF